MLAGIATGAFADQTTDLAIVILKFDYVAFTAFYDSTTMAAFETDVANPVFCIMALPTLGDGAVDFHVLQIIQAEGCVVIAAGVFIILFGWSLKPGENLLCRHGCRIEGYEMRTGHKELSADTGVYNGDDLFVFGDLDFEVVIDLHNTT